MLVKTMFILDEQIKNKVGRYLGTLLYTINIKFKFERSAITIDTNNKYTNHQVYFLITESYHILATQVRCVNPEI